MGTKSGPPTPAESSFGKKPIADPATSRRREKMKKYGNLGFCNDLLKSLHGSNQLESETRSKLERARKKLNRLKRNRTASNQEVFEAVREVAEALYESLKGGK
jgi:hypothetical protein